MKGETHERPHDGRYHDGEHDDGCIRTVTVRRWTPCAGGPGLLQYAHGKARRGVVGEAG